MKAIMSLLTVLATAAVMVGFQRLAHGSQPLELKIDPLAGCESYVLGPDPLFRCPGDVVKQRIGGVVRVVGPDTGSAPLPPVH